MKKKIPNFQNHRIVQEKTLITIALQFTIFPII